MRMLTVDELIIITGAGANTATENVGHMKNYGRNRGDSASVSAGAGNCPPYMNPIFQDCMNGILGGLIGGSAGGPGAAVAGAIGSGMAACTSNGSANNGSGNNSDSGDIGGQCSW